MRKQTKNWLWVFFACILLVLVLEFFVFNREGLDMGGVAMPGASQCEYSYLAPPVKDKDGNVKQWSDSTLTKYIEKFNSVNPPDKPDDKMDKTKFMSFNKILGLSEEEGKYFAQNGKYPLNPFIVNTLKNDEKVRDLIRKHLETSKLPLTPDDINKSYSSRIIYGAFIAPTEPLDPPSLARQIYNGQTVGPNCETTGSAGSSFSDTDKEKLREVCKNL